MQRQKDLTQRLLGAVAAILVLATLTAAKGTNDTFPDIKIKNFGQMDERFYRGAQPKKLEDYQALAALGIKTVIDLRNDPKSYEKGMVESVGMKYVNLPMSDKKYPQEAQIDAFLSLINEPGTGAFYVHCAGGRHRTGVMGAVYRFTKYGWNFDQVYKEMKDFDFYTRWGHGDMKKYVVDYSQRAPSVPVTDAVAAGN